MAKLWRSSQTKTQPLAKWQTRRIFRTRELTKHTTGMSHHGPPLPVMKTKTYMHRKSTVTTSGSRRWHQNTTEGWSSRSAIVRCQSTSSERVRSFWLRSNAGDITFLCFLLLKSRGHMKNVYCVDIAECFLSFFPTERARCPPQVDRLFAWWNRWSIRVRTGVLRSQRKSAIKRLKKTFILRHLFNMKSTLMHEILKHLKFEDPKPRYTFR